MTKFVGFELYGGATITRVLDASGAEWIGCTARRNADQRFGFYLFKNGVEVPYTPFCTGRGSITEQGLWIASSDKDYFTGTIPGFVALPASVALEKQVTAFHALFAAIDQELAAVSARLDGSPPVISDGALILGPQGPPLEGGEIRLADGAGGWIVLDGRAGNLRIVLTGTQALRVFAGGVLAEQWPKV